MSFEIKGHPFCEISPAGISGSPGLGFIHLHVHLELVMRERRHEGLPTLTELCGELAVMGAEGTSLCLGALLPSCPPAWGSVCEPVTTISMNIELERGRIEALETFRNARGFVLMIALHGRVQIGQEHHLAHDALQLEVSHETWVGILEQLKDGSQPRERDQSGFV